MSDKLAPNQQEALPLVAAQPGIWMAEQLTEKANRFTVAHYVDFHGTLDAALFEQAIRRGLADGDMVHARFAENDNGQPVQYLPDNISVEQVIAPEWYDFTAHKNPKADALALMHQDMEQPLAAEGPRPLYRQMLIEIEPGRWFWYQRFHHLILDGFGFARLTAHIVAIYQALRQGQTIPDSPFTAFASVVEEYQQWENSPAYQTSKTFWHNHIIDLPPPMTLAQPESDNFSTDSQPRFQTCSLADISFKQVSQHSGWEPSEWLLAGLCIWFYRMSGEPRLSVGFPFMRRMGSAALTALGPVVNVLPLQLGFSAEMSMRDTVNMLVKEIKTVRRHQRYEAEYIRRDLGLVGGEQTLYSPVINFKAYQDDLIIDGQAAMTHTLAMGPVDDLEIEIDYHNNKLTLVANSTRYSQATLLQHAERLHYLLTQLVSEPDKPLGDSSLLSAEEQHRIENWSFGPRRPSEYPADVSILDWLLRRVAATPQDIAVVSGEHHLTYQAFHDRVMQLARVLIQQGIGAEDVVALGLARSEQAVIAIFAVLASGGSYLPLDMDYPAERLALMCEDAQPKAIIACAATRQKMPTGFNVLDLDKPAVIEQCKQQSTQAITDIERREPLQGEHLAYMIYTSGSTGRPKGVMIPHKGLLNLLVSHDSHLFGPAIRTLEQQHQRRMRAAHTASFSFDSSWEPLFCMLMGAELMIFNEELRRDAWALVQQMHVTPIDIMDVTPSFLLQMIDSGLLDGGQPAPHVLMIGGEAATPRLWETMQANPQIAFYNYYGPSEYTIDTLGASVKLANEPVIGRPVAQTDVWLLDNRLQPVPIGVAGELYISGAGIARGYLRRPDLTAARFVANPFRRGEVMYRTGDLMRWRADGQLAFIGRTDHQIKVRGFRVELGEVENALANIAEVANAVVIAEPVGATWRLIGFCAIADASSRQRPDIVSELQQALAQQLPEYMVPGVIVVLESLPMMINGKVDRQALPAVAEVFQSEGRAAETTQEQAICNAIGQVLGLNRVSAEDDFFALGGDSISAMSLGNQLRRAGWQLRPKEIFAGRTPAAMARILRPLADKASLIQGQRYGHVEHLPILRWYAEQGAHSFAQGLFIATPEILSPEQLCQMMQRIVAAHPALSARWIDNVLITENTAFVAAQCQCLQVAEDETQSAEQAFQQAVQRLDPQNGKLWQAVLLQKGNRCLGLVWVIHHLVVDGVSWRILLEALPVAARALNEPQTELASENTSLIDWSQWLKEQLLPARQALPFWQQMLTLPAELPLVTQLDPQRDTQATRGEIRTQLSVAQSAALLGELPQIYRTRTDVLLLAALLIASRKIWQQDALRVSLESHGRPADHDEIDLSRTLGWLTAEYPVCFTWDDLDKDSSLNAVRAVKSVLDAISDNGIEYGILRYLDPQQPLTELAQLHAPQVLFNYLGRFDNGQLGLWRPRVSERVFRDTLAIYTNDQMPLSYALELNIFVGQGDTPQLAIHWGYACNLLNKKEILTLERAFSDAVTNLITFAQCQPQQASDTLSAAQTATGLNSTDMAVLRNRYGILGDVLPLLPLQQGLLFHAHTTQNSGSYNSLTQLTLQGPLDHTRLQNALNRVVEHYPQLAAWFDSEHASQPVQILPLEGDARLHWPLDSYVLASEQDVEKTILLLEQQELERSLFASQGPMLHALWVQHPQAQCHTLFLTAHHLVVDGWSTPVILQSLMTLLQSDNTRLPAPPVSYSTLIRQLAGRDIAHSHALWKTQMQDISPLLLFGEPGSDGPVNTLVHQLPIETEKRLNTFCRQQGVTLNTLMQGIWGLLLSISSGSNDVVFGSPVSGRMADSEALDQQVGLFSNTLPVRVCLDMAQPLLSQLHDLQQRQIELLEHDNIGLAEIQRLAGTGTLFDTLLVVENYPDPQAQTATNARVHCLDIHNRGYTHYPLTLLILPGERLTLHLEYRPQVNAPQALLDRFVFLLEQLLAEPTRPLSQWTLVTPQEQAFIHQINQTDHVLAPETLYEAISAQRLLTPNAIALQDAAGQLSWQSMHEHVCVLAGRLQQAGVKAGDIVAVALPRSMQLSLALQAIVALGAAWLPLDVGYPDERLFLMIEDATPRLVIVDQQQQARFNAYAHCLNLDEKVTSVPAVSLPKISPQHAAYVLYTSGSTGRPKGVVVSHEAIINRLRWMQSNTALHNGDVVLQKTPCSFDVSVWEFFWPLMVGAKLVMAPPEAHRDPEALIRLIEDYHVTTLHFVPSMLASWLDSLAALGADVPCCPRLKQVFCSGEALSCELARRYARLINAPLYNLYGPTEAAIDVTCQVASGTALASVKGAGVPIGKPVWNTRLYILDPWLRPVPPGAPGELWLSGVQLAQSYYGRADLTASRFVADPYRQGQRMYRTGDIARWLAEGSVDYLGRTDDQLKIRGQRIELGEIEQALLSLPGVAQAAVDARELVSGGAGGDNRQLIAWVIMCDSTSWEPQALQLALAAVLPAHMLPVRYMQVDAFPLSASGKLMRKNLPLPQVEGHGGKPLCSASEHQVAALFTELLGVDSLYADDDFFALGGHSLLAMRLSVALRRQFDRPIAIGQIMAARTVSQLATLMDGSLNLTEAERRGSGVVLPLRNGQGPALFCFHPASGFAWQYSGLLRYLSGQYPVIGLQSPRPHGVIASAKDMDEACEQHLATLRQYQPQGPYFLLGYSLGGTLAQGVAARLTAQGEQVAFLGLLDTWPPEGQDWSGPDEQQAKEEVAREQAEFMADSLEEQDPELLAEKQAMFSTIVANYQDAVRLLSQAKSPVYPGTATLFMATRTLPKDMDPRRAWAPYVTGLDIYAQDCEHADILDPATLVKLGPLLNQLLEAARSSLDGLL